MNDLPLFNQQAICKHETWLVPDMALFKSMRDYVFTVRCKECGFSDVMLGFEIYQAMSRHIIQEEIDKANRLAETPYEYWSWTTEAAKEIRDCVGDDDSTAEERTSSVALIEKIIDKWYQKCPSCEGRGNVEDAEGGVQVCPDCNGRAERGCPF